jgi:hypothetical protein
MDIRNPSQQQRHRRENLDRQENAKVPRPRRRCCRVDDEPCACQGRCEGAEGPAQLEFVREPAEGDDGEEAEDVGRGGEALALDAGEGAHFGDDGGDEEGEGGEGDVAVRELVSEGVGSWFLRVFLSSD